MATLPANVADFKDWFDRDFTYGAGLDRVRDKDIDRAFATATPVFNNMLWDTDAERKTAFLFVSAHFLALNLQAAGGLTAKLGQGQGANSQGSAVVATKSVGSVSVGYQWPEFVTSSRILSQFMRTKYGEQYLQLAIPRLVGNVAAVRGPQNPDIAIPNIPFQ